MLPQYRRYVTNVRQWVLPWHCCIPKWILDTGWGCAKKVIAWVQTFGPYPKKIFNRCTLRQEHIQPISGVESQRMCYLAARSLSFLNTKTPEVHCRKELQNRGWQHYLQWVQRDPCRNHQNYQNYHKSPLSRAKSRRNYDKMDAYSLADAEILLQ